MRILKTVTIVSCLLSATMSLSNTLSKDELKQKILKISRQYTTQTKKADEAKQKILPLVNQLVEIDEERSEAEKLDQVVGSWKNVWSYRTFGPIANYNQVYQIVDPSGYYYNLSQQVVGRFKFASFLRGEFKDAGDKLRIRFTSNRITKVDFSEELDLVDLTQRFEAGEIPSVPFFGPIGFEGDLINSYVDEELRIVMGRTDGGSLEDLFVLVRAETISPD